MIMFFLENEEIFLPGMSTSVIAGMELRYPDDEDRKNAVCKPIVVPQLDSDLFLAFDVSSHNQRAAMKELGMMFFSNKRVDPLYHLSFFTKIRFMATLMRKQAKVDKQFEKYIKQIEAQKQ